MSDLLEELALEPCEELALEPEPVPAAVVAAVEAATALPAPAALMQVLPADFPLPTLIRFVPDPALRTAADDAAKYALSLEVREAEGVQRADAALTALRSAIKAIETSFKDPAEIANQLHKQITGTRAEWCATAKGALDLVGKRVATELRRLQTEAQERARKAQEEEDRKERDRRRQEAAAAEKAQAPAPVVQQMRQQAETATAPPVTVSAPAPKLTGSSAVGTWKARIAGTPASDAPNPSMADLTPAQRAKVCELLRAILDGHASLTLLDLNWSGLNARAKAERSAFSIPGFESFEDLGLRGRSSRAK